MLDIDVHIFSAFGQLALLIFPQLRCVEEIDLAGFQPCVMRQTAL